MTLAIGVDIGGTKILAGVVDEHGAVLDTERRPTPGRDVRATEGAIAEVVEVLRSRNEGALTQPECAVGVGAAGWIGADRATVLFSPHLAWREEALRDALAQRMPGPVIIENDANAAAWAEYRFGAARGASVVVCITLGTGIGGGMVVDGRVYRGAYGIAGEFGHMRLVPEGRRCACGNRGCWEMYASGRALARDARELADVSSIAAERMIELADGDPMHITGPVVTQAAREGDPAALEIFESMGRWLGHGIASLAAALDPQVFVIGGGLSEAGDLLLAPARETFRGNLSGRGFRPLAEVEIATLGPMAGLVGAADLARASVGAVS